MYQQWIHALVNLLTTGVFSMYERLPIVMHLSVLIFDMLLIDRHGEFTIPLTSVHFHVQPSATATTRGGCQIVQIPDTKNGMISYGSSHLPISS